MANWVTKLIKRTNKVNESRYTSILRRIVGGSLYRISSLRGTSSVETIRNQIDTMRALATDSQIATALAYYATDATIPNSNGDIIWATAVDSKHQDVADIINTKLKAWDVNKYARDHILELATVGNLYLPTTKLYRDPGSNGKELVSLDGNTIRNDAYEVIPSTKVDPQTIIHTWYQGQPDAYYIEDENGTTRYDEAAVIHFALGGLLGDYTMDGKTSEGDLITLDIQFGQPLMGAATQPTQTLNLLEDALVLSSLTRMVRFVNVECGVGAEEEEIQATLQEIKDMVEQQLSINTNSGDAQSFVNPQSPNNLIYVPRVNGNDPISITDLNMAEATDADNKLLQYYQDKKLSVLGVPKEAMNFSSAEGLGGAGAVMSQRSALYGNSLQRIETAYKEGWRSAFNHYFIEHGNSGFVDTFQLHMNPIITQMSTVSSERKDSALSQADQIISILEKLGVTDEKAYKEALVEVVTEALPTIGSNINGWRMDVEAGGEDDSRSY